MTNLVTIQVEQDDFHRLQQYAEPLVDTPASALRKVLDKADASADEKSTKMETKENPLPIIFFAMPPITHTKFLGGVFEGRDPEKNTWDAFLRLALEICQSKAGDFDKLKRASGANIVAEVKNDKGYKYNTKLRFSYQGVSADDALSIIERLAKHFGLQWRAEFEWRDKQEAAFPGQRATLGMAHGQITGGII